MPDSSIHFKCIQADGSTLFTDRPCLSADVIVAQKEILSSANMLSDASINPLLGISINPLLAIAVVYFLMSILSFIMYFTDKKRSVSGDWRIPEKTLHLLDLSGGWPGGFIAQQRFRHKTCKSSFQWVFRIIVGLHLLCWGDFVLGFPLLNSIIHFLA